MPSDRGALRKLGEALLNATLMLIAMILLLAVVLVVQLRGLGSDLRADMAGWQARSDAAMMQAQQALETLDAARDGAGEALPQEIARARTELGAALENWRNQGPEGESGSTLRRMLMAAVAAAAREAQVGRAAP